MRLLTKLLAALQVSQNFFFPFPKKWVGRAMGNETFYGDGLKSKIFFLLSTVKSASKSPAVDLLRFKLTT